MIEVEEKKYKRLVTIIIILLLIIVLMLGYIVYDVVTSSNNKLSKNDIVDVPNKDNGSQENKNNETKEENFDLDKAKQILEGIEYTKFYNISSDEIESLKLQIAFNKTESQAATCDSIYSNLPNAKKDEFGYYDVTLDNEDFTNQTLCNNSTKVILYKDVNATYIRLFGNNTILPKRDIGGYSYCDGNYDYIEGLDAFAHLYFSPDGCYSENKEINIINSAKSSDDELTIEVSSKVLEWNGQGGYDVTIGDKKVSFEQSKVEKEDFDKDFFGQYSQYMQVYRFAFELEDGNYILKNIDKY